ncbi:MAG: DNA polymerase IV [Gemmatimonadetes bacterium]|nr:DNA polymerase IV [Gemmatimonadota bacterium]MXX73585.1 DNA polymerase IV [Gemmatimonadota bacterium]MYC90311.1 DNA polymerase IV [Gemmatimonadota bacterium]MYG36174.1 DNA polymerase IV [Gemmatimonadota bacterium]
MMPSVVDLHRAGVDVRLECVMGVPQIGELEGIGHLSGLLRAVTLRAIRLRRAGDRTLSKDRMPSQGARRILLVDCDSFFVQVARLEDPGGAGKHPLLLVGGRSGRGVITSASYAVREYGVRSGMPTAQALKLCPEALVVPVPRGAVVERSRAVKAVLKELSPVVQAASVDEFYLDLTGTERMLRGEDLAATADRIRRVVRERTEVAVSLGGGTQRVVAKVATRLAKPNGVHVVPPGDEAAFMARFRLEALPGIGPAFLKQLAGKGLSTCADVTRVERAWLSRWFGPARGAWLWERVRGIDASEVDARDRRKSISSERTFFADVDDHDELERRLLELTCRVGGQLRAKDLRARTVTVKIRDHDFTTRQAGSTQTAGLETDRAIFTVAASLLHDLRHRRKTPVRLLGVGASNLVRQAPAEQLDFFGGEAALETERDRTIARAVDRIHDRYGREALRPARVLDSREETPPGDRSRTSR